MRMTNMRTLSEAEFHSTLKTSQVPVLVMFGAPWCGPCKSLKPILESVASEKAGSLLVCYVDCEECPDVAQKASIKGFPTMVLFKDGNEVTRAAGLMPKARLMSVFGL